jgi:hypothetical protein
VALLDVKDANEFLSACDELMARWNALITASNAAVELNFAAEEIEIGGKTGKRFYVDMAEAVEVPRSKEITKVMTEMFGAEGILNWYVLPMEGNRVLVANIPREEVEKLASSLKGGVAKPIASSGTGGLQFDASAYVDWGKRRDLAMTGEVIGGPKFVPLPKSEPLNAELKVIEGAVQMEIVLPQSLLETLGKHLQEVREP